MILVSKMLPTYITCRMPQALLKRMTGVVLAAACLVAAPLARPQETVCARVKIEIKQELTLERQAFDAEMRISNTTDSSAIDNVGVVVKVTDESGTPVAVSDDPNNTGAKFFLRLSRKENIVAVDGSGSVAPKTVATINWLLIPAPGSAGTGALGKKYLVGATLRYRFGGQETVLEVAPDVITVKPLPSLTLDYFIPQDVWADDPLTAAIEATEPFTLGVRVKNNGLATAKGLKIDSAQPKIVENVQGLLINFLLTGSYLNDAPTQNSLLINFGDIAGGGSKMGRWNMETTLAGKFVDFTASFSHADELGGALTSIMQAANAHFLIHDVRVDLPGRDAVRDFLGRDGDVLRLYESDGPDTVVSDQSAQASLIAGTDVNGVAGYRLRFPATAGFAYVRLPDPFNGAKAIGAVTRSDAKQLGSENVWLSKTRNAQTKKWEYWINFFDANTSGVYDSQFQATPATPRAPVVQFVPDRTVKEGRQVSFLVEASSPDGKALSLGAAPLPAGAGFTQQAADPGAPGLTRAVFDWTPAKGRAGTYLVVYSANDGSLTTTRSASIKVEADTAPAGPAAPTIASPLAGAQVRDPAALVLAVNSALQPGAGATVQFELYADEAASQLLASATLAQAGSAAAPLATSWAVPLALSDNTHYWWRARAFDGTLYSTWTGARLFANSGNDGPEMFNLTSPLGEGLVASVTPQLAWNNSADLDGDAITYQAMLYQDAELRELLAQSPVLAQDPSGMTSWTVPLTLSDRGKYYWRVQATDAQGASRMSALRGFTVNLSNQTPSVPLLRAPAMNAQSAGTTVKLEVSNSVDAERDVLSYVFEVDSVNSFDSPAKVSIGGVAQNVGASTARGVSGLLENQAYWWRAKARDGHTESAWMIGRFMVNAANQAPAVPTVKNPGHGAWSASLQPSLEAYPVKDPENAALRYQFEVYRDAALSSRLLEASSSNSGVIVPLALTDNTSYWWRVRALDAQGAASAWSPAALLHVRAGGIQPPGVNLSAPAVAQQAHTVDGRKTLAIRWEGADPNRSASVALFYTNSRNGLGGTRIVDGLRLGSGAAGGEYLWDVTALAPGAYYVYAETYDATGVSRSYAPGALVQANPASTASIQISAAAPWREAALQMLTVSASGASGASLSVPVLGVARNLGAELVLLPQAGSASRLIPVAVPYQCDKHQTSVAVQVGPLVTEDGNLIGRAGAALAVPLTYASSNIGDETLRVCELRIVSERKVNATQSDFVVTGKLSNFGTPVIRGKVVPYGVSPSVSGMDGVTLMSGALTFGPVAKGEVGVSSTSVTLRSMSGARGVNSILTKGIKWASQLAR
ncbi:MAG: hypothetical protein V4754_07155 [Pseudomonadota bacterium]